MIGWIFLSLAIAGCLYLGFALLLILRARQPAYPILADADCRPVTVLKPLHGDEPLLFDNLARLCRQRYAAAIQIVCGVQSATDPAIRIVEELKRDYPQTDIELVIDATEHGSNRKVSNLINMMRAARHDLLVLADSDIAVAEDYIAKVTAPLADPRVGGVTCLYAGEPVSGFWATLNAQAINTHFLPDVLVGLSLGLAKPCFGSTIVLSRTCLGHIGGFEAFRDVLADDYAVGAAIREAGYEVTIPEMLVTHRCSENSFRELWAHEIRWSRTILSVDRAGFIGSLVTHPAAWALAAVLTGQVVLGFLAFALAIVLRVMVARATMARFERSALSYGAIVPRELLSFAVYAWSFVGRKLAWRGQDYHVNTSGRLTKDRG